MHNVYTDICTSVVYSRQCVDLHGQFLTLVLVLLSHCRHLAPNQCQVCLCVCQFTAQAPVFDGQFIQLQLHIVNLFL